jgi:hypothetical protein
MLICASVISELDSAGPTDKDGQSRMLKGGIRLRQKLFNSCQEVSEDKPNLQNTNHFSSLLALFTT